MANTVLPWSFSAVTGNTFCYLAHAHAAYQRQQGQRSALLAMYSAYNGFCYYG